MSNRNHPLTFGATPAPPRPSETSVSRPCCVTVSSESGKPSRRCRHHSDRPNTVIRPASRSYRLRARPPSMRQLPVDRPFHRTFAGPMVSCFGGPRRLSSFRVPSRRARWPDPRETLFQSAIPVNCVSGQKLFLRNKLNPKSEKHRAQAEGSVASGNGIGLAFAFSWTDPQE